MSVTLQNLRDVFYSILREAGPSSAYPEILCDLFLNSAQQDIIAGRLIHPITKEEVVKGDMHFNNADTYFANVGMTYCTADTAIGSATLPATTTNYPSSGCIFTEGQIIEYTGVTATEFTGCTGILFPIKSGTPISIAFKLPDDFNTVINVVYNDRFKLPAQQYDDMFENLNSFKGSNYTRNQLAPIYNSPYRVKPFYTIKDAQYLIVYQLNEDGAQIHLRYMKAAPLMTTLVGPVIDNDIYAQSCIPYLAVAEMLYNRGEEIRAGNIYSMAISRVRKMYSFYNDTVYESQNGVQYGMGKGRLNI